MFNYYFDTDRDGHADTVRMFEAIGNGEYEGYTSQYATIELQKAEEPKKSNMLALIEKYGIILLDTDDEAIRLAKSICATMLFPKNTHLTERILGLLRCTTLIIYYHLIFSI